MLINAMLKRPYPPISLPARQYMENAKVISEELGLPPLKPQTPWYGSRWANGGEIQVESADRAVRSGFWTGPGEVIKQRRRNDKRMNNLCMSL